MPKELSHTAKSIIAILNNVNELVTLSSNREDAKDVIKAMRIYANDLNYPIPEEKLDDFVSVLLDSRPITVTYLLRDIAFDIAQKDLKK